MVYLNELQESFGSKMPREIPAALSFREFKEARYFRGLNGVRCFAAVAVIWHHTNRPSSTSLLAHGHIGVDFFFVLSGFLISTLLLRERERFGSISLKNFWVRRALRLFPPYYCLLLGMGIMYMLFRRDDPEFLRFLQNIHVYAFYYSNWSSASVGNLGHAWSLATEEQFYLIWPLVETFTRPGVGGATWILAVLTNQLMNFGFLDPALRNFGMLEFGRSEITEVTYTPILLGVGLAHLLHRESSFFWVRRFAAWPGAAGTYFLSIIVLLSIGLPLLDGLPRLIIHLLITLFLATLILCPDRGTAKFLQRRPFDYLGTISYGMYLYHMVPTALFSTLLSSRAPVLVFPLTLLMSIGIAVVSYRVLEQPVLRLGERFRQQQIVRDPSFKNDVESTPAGARNTPGPSQF